MSAVRFYMSATFLASVSCNVNHNLIHNVEMPFKVCIDDSDCGSQVNDYAIACFQYICYPWKNDSSVPEENRKATCKKSDHCGSDQGCFRHYYRKKVHRGLCMEHAVDCSKNGVSDCIDGRLVKPWHKQRIEENTEL